MSDEQEESLDDDIIEPKKKAFPVNDLVITMKKAFPDINIKIPLPTIITEFFKPNVVDTIAE